MGGGTSSVDQELFNTLKKEYELAKTVNRDENDSGDEIDSGGKIDDDSVLYEKVNNIYKQWKRKIERRTSTIFSELIGLERSLDIAFATNKTPLILDASPDDRVCTFFSYQPGVIILEAKQLVVEGNRRGQKHCWEISRKALVNAMKHGKLLVIRLGTTAPDFIGKFCDDTHFPLSVFLTAGSELRSEDWVSRLFRPEDSFPHKNFAICRDEFRVCVASQMPLGVIDEYLFDSGCLPDATEFKVIEIAQDKEDTEGDDGDSIDLFWR
jgi:hypothetical protein